MPDGRKFREFVCDIISINNLSMRNGKAPTYNDDDECWTLDDPFLGSWGVEHFILNLIGVPEDSWDNDLANRALRSGGRGMAEELLVGTICRDSSIELINSLGIDREEIMSAIDEITELGASVLAEQEHYEPPGE